MLAYAPHRASSSSRARASSSRACRNPRFRTIPGRHQNSVTTPPLANLLADGHDLGDGFVAESKRLGKQPSRRHGKIEIAPYHRERPHDGASRTRHDGIRVLLPLRATRLNECQSTHEAQCSPGSSPACR